MSGTRILVFCQGHAGQAKKARGWSYNQHYRLAGPEAQNPLPKDTVLIDSSLGSGANYAGLGRELRCLVIHNAPGEEGFVNLAIADGVVGNVIPVNNFTPDKRLVESFVERRKHDRKY